LSESFGGSLVLLIEAIDQRRRLGVRTGFVVSDHFVNEERSIILRGLFREGNIVTPEALGP
jgi:hypothetical protein